MNENIPPMSKFYFTKKERDWILNNFLQHLTKEADMHSGYPYNFSYDLEPLKPFLDYTINNLGDPFVSGLYGLHAKKFEMQAIHWFSQLYDLQHSWGYVTSGGTEGNIYGLFLGRELYPDAVLYYSKDSHYSLPKTARLARIPEVVINSQPNGEIDYEHLEQELSSRKHLSAIVNVNLGTTLKGAVDNHVQVIDILDKLKMRFHIHCDGALGGMLLPFIDNAPKISFKDYPIGSIAVSGHKFIGAPVPCGIVLARREDVKKIEINIDYIGSLDTTILGSRTGLGAISLWYGIASRGEQFAEEVSGCLQNAKYLYDGLRQIGIIAMLNDFSNTVVFENPGIDLCHKWHLANSGNWAHIVVMQNLSSSHLDTFIEDMKIWQKTSKHNAG